MKFINFVSFLLLIYEASFYLVIGQTINNEKNDCTKLYNFARKDNKVYAIGECCSEPGIRCSDTGYITNIER